MSKNIKFLLFALSLLALLVLAYSNHFNNGFYFDDAHTISSNAYITDLSNTLLFFTDASTFSSLPANQAYRPMVTFMNALDYWLAGGLNPVYFHASIFFWYIVQLILMFFFFRTILNISFNRHPFVPIISLGMVGLYGLHTANAETINYIISRSDSFSTLCIIASFVLFQHKPLRKYYLYLVTMVIGIWTKQTGVMFVPLLFLYVLLFEEKFSWQDVKARVWITKTIATLKETLPVITAGFSLFLINQFIFTPHSTVSSNTGVSKWDYFMTQWYIITHYLSNFILPMDLSADPDFVVISSFFDPRILSGLCVILLLLFVALYSFKSRKLVGVGFGLLWFFIALLPSSSFVPLFQIANDHRTFFPYIGLILSIGVLVCYIAVRFDTIINSNKLIKPSALVYFMLVCGVFAYGTYKRNEVWHNSESLWHDVTIKSPKNGRGQMNYGLTLMAKGDYKQAMMYFDRAMKVMPRYSYLYINIAILKNATGQPKVAEEYFLNAIRFDKENPETFYHYAGWLLKQSRFDEAKKNVSQALALSPGHSSAKSLLTRIEVKGNGGVKALEKDIVDNPTADKYINLSLLYYKSGKHKKSITACEKALGLNPNSSLAYNNMCSAYNQIKEWKKAEQSCLKALELNPDYQLAKNNLNWSQTEVKITPS
ncbi:MAG: hypothetical protein JKY53_00390 [Flavobacteriales bacterium]|nr:hypothetical protein [Flavobacteriales bacterium]